MGCVSKRLESAQAFGDYVLMRTKRVVRQRFPVRKAQIFKLRTVVVGTQSDAISPPISPGRFSGNYHTELFDLFCHLHYSHHVAAAGQAGPVQAHAGLLG